MTGPAPLPLSRYQMDMAQLGRALSVLGRTAGRGLIEHAGQSGVKIPPELTDPERHPSPEEVISSLRDVAGQFFPRLASAG